MDNPKTCYVAERLQNETRILAFQRIVLPRFDNTVEIEKYLETSSEIYFVLNTIISEKPIKFIFVVYIKRRKVNGVNSWQFNCYFEKDQPPFYNCPQNYFDLCPTTNPLSLAWRAKIRKLRSINSKSSQNNRHIYKLAEFFEVGDTINHPSYGDLYIQHIDLVKRAFWCLNENHKGSRKYKLPLMPLEHWELNIKSKKAKQLAKCS